MQAGAFEEQSEAYTDRLDLRGAFTGRLRNDPPLLYELGIDLGLIKTESLLPINVLRARTAPPLGRGSDLTGPILILALFTALLVLHGKIHFGYIYFISLCSCASVYTLLALLSTREISALVCCSVLGYSMGPLLLFSALGIVLRWAGVGAQLCLGFAAALWGSYTATTVFCEHLALHNRLAVVGYPIFLVYTAFMLMVVF